MYRIKLSENYGGQNKKQIGEFHVVREWQECTKEVYEIALNFEGTVFDLEPATKKPAEEPKPVTPPITVEIKEEAEDNSDDIDDTVILTPEELEEPKEDEEAEPSKIEGVNIVVKDEPTEEKTETIPEEAEPKTEPAKKPKGGGSKKGGKSKGKKVKK